MYLKIQMRFPYDMSNSQLGGLNITRGNVLNGVCVNPLELWLSPRVQHKVYECLNAVSFQEKNYTEVSRTICVFCSCECAFVHGTYFSAIEKWIFRNSRLSMWWLGGILVVAASAGASLFGFTLQGVFRNTKNPPLPESAKLSTLGRVGSHVPKAFLHRQFEYRWDVHKVQR